MREKTGPDSVDETLAAASRTIDLNVLGDRIRNLRIAAGMTQGKLAGSDASVAYISRIEAGKRRPDLALLATLASRLGATVEELLVGISRDRKAELRLELDYADLALRSGNAPDAFQKASDVLDAAAGTSDDGLVREAVLIKARALEALGHLDDAIIALEQLVDSDPIASQWVQAAIALTRCYRESGDLSRATEAGERCLARLRDLALDGTDEGIQLAVTLAGAYNERGDRRHAIRICRVAADKAELLDSPKAKAAAYWNASIFESEQGRTDAAIPLAKQALALLESDGDNRHLARLHSQLGMFLLASDTPDPAEAKRSLERAAVELEWSAASVIERAYNSVALARSMLLLGDIAEAEAMLNGIAENATRAPLLASDCALLRGQISAVQGNTDAARASYLDSVQILASVGADRAAAQMWVDLGTLLDELGESDAANSAFRSAVAATGLAISSRPVGSVRT
ncbi:helix-turn-helix domain-containing protein [Marmoricola sp. RAF53]|uniref:helix-turn-helix domain-containing protein n=1 Tax=Marmoricola sp. RAF53 TaxID=3233059 RepID=UPI003F98125A